MVALTRIKNNQITDNTIIASTKIVPRSVTGGLLSDPLMYSGNVNITGNLSISGTTTTLDTTNTSVTDPLIVVNKNASGSPTVDQGMIFSRGSSINAALIWDESNDQFAVLTTTETGSTAGTIDRTSYADFKMGNITVANTSTFGNLQVGNNTIISTNSNGNITLDPNGTGQVVISAAANIANNVSFGSYVDFAQIAYASRPAYQEGRMYYDSDEKTLVLYGSSTDMEIAIGEREWVRCRNSTASTIPKGTAVYVTGVHIAGHPVHGHHPTIQPADAADANKIGVIGVAAQDILASNHGYVVCRGYIHNLDTSALMSGMAVYLCPDEPGLLCMDPPDYPNHPVKIGICLTSDATNGTLYVDLLSQSFDKFRVTGNQFIDGDLTIGGTLKIGGGGATQIETLEIRDNYLYLGAGDNVVKTFLGTGLDDITYHNHFTGGTAKTFYVKIDSVGSPDTFAWSYDNFATTEASGVAIDGDEQLLAYGVSIQFVSTSGHTLNDTWTGVGTPKNLDFGYYSNYVSGGVYTHSGIFRDASDNKFKLFKSYDPEITGNINTSDASFALGDLQIQTLVVEGNANVGNLGTAGAITASNTVTGGNLSTAGTLGVTGNANVGNLDTNIVVTTGNVTVGNILTVQGNRIDSSSNTAILLSGEDVTIRGNLIVQGNSTSIGSENYNVQDSIINIHTLPNLAPLTADDGRDIGIKMHYYKSSDKHAFIGWANDTGYLEYYGDATEGIGGTVTGQYGTIKANVFYAGVPNGTAPLTIDSTTRVANLNVAVAGNLINGNSNVIVDANSNVHISVAGNADILSITGTGANISGTANVTGNVDFGANINTTAATINLANATTTTVNFAGAATTVNIGATTGTTSVKNSLDVDANINMDGTDFTTTQATVNLANANTTTLNVGGAATTVNIGSSSGTTHVKNSLDVDANINMDGANFTVTQSTVNIANANATTINFGGAATAINLGVATGQTTLLGNLSVGNNFVVTANSNLANIRIVDNTVSSINTNANINIDPNGTGSIVLNSTGDNSNIVINGNTTSGYSNAVFINAVTGSVGFRTNTIPTGAIAKFNSLDSIIVPVGASGDRPSGVQGMVRFNTGTSKLEFYSGSGWESASNSFTVVTVDSFTGDGSTLVYTLSQSSSTAGLLVAINGVIQQPTVAYGVTGGTTLTFTEAPAADDVIDARVITTTYRVNELAEGNTSILLVDTGSDGNVVIKTDGVTRAFVNDYVIGENLPTVVTIANVSVGNSETVIDEWPLATYRSARYTIQASHASAGYEISEVAIVHNGSAAFKTQYGLTYTGGSSLGTVNVTVQSGNVQLTYTGSNTANTVRVAPTYIPI